MTLPRALLALPLAAVCVIGTVTAASYGSAQGAREPAAKLSFEGCADTMATWFEREIWPTDELAMGDQLYDRTRLSVLNHNRGNAIADMALALATAQLNLAAGAEPSPQVVDVIFEADQWLLDSDSTERRSQTDVTNIARVLSTLESYNWAAASEGDCSY